MPLDQRYLAQNVRRLAGMHLVSMETLARYVGVSRPTLQAMVAHEAAQRSFPRAETSMRIAEAFGISLNALYSEPMECLREALPHLHDAPIAAVSDPPTSVIEAFAKVTKMQAEALTGIDDARRSRRSKTRRQTRRKGG